MKTPHKHAEALAQPEPKPNATRPCRSCVGTGLRDTGVDEAPTAICKPCDGTGQIAIAAQPKREWVGLTPTDFEKLEKLYGNKVSNGFVFADIICSIEALSKEKNT